MEISKALLEERKEWLLQRRDDLLGEANSVNGALQDVDYWLGILETPRREAGQGSSESATSVLGDEVLHSPSSHSAGGMEIENEEVVSCVKNDRGQFSLVIEKKPKA